MSKIKLVVFDMAGTTVNEGNIVYKTLQRCIAEAGYPIELKEVLSLGAGKEKRQAIIDILQQVFQSEQAEDQSLEIFQNFKVKLEEAYRDLEVSTYPGVESLLAKLKEQGIKIVLNTGYDSKTARTLIAKLGWQVGDQIDGLVTADDVVRGRPEADMILKAMEITRIDDPEQVLKAGDSAIDIEEGKNAHCGMTVGVLTGAQTEAQLKQAQPTYILDSLAQLEEILLPK